MSTADDRAALTAAGARTGLDTTSATLLSRHATSVYLLPGHDVVVRLSRGTDRDRAHTTLALTGWLIAQGFPATGPADVPHQPVDVADTTVTFWRHYPQPDRPAPPAAALGALLHDLHTLPDPPVTLHDYQPLTRLGAVLDRPTPALSDRDRSWLLQAREQLLGQYARLDSHLGYGFVHGDAYPGNTLWGPDPQVLLGDWDEAARAPRELDLVNTHQGARFGRSTAERDAFTAAYGWDVTTWPGFPTLRAMRDLHTLAAFIERSNASDESAAAQLQHRLSTLQNDDVTACWNAA